MFRPGFALLMTAGLTAGFSLHTQPVPGATALMPHQSTGAAGGATATGSAPAVGDPAPDFSLRYATRDSVASQPLKLSAVVGRGPVVLAFYPADWSGGCTKEVCEFRDHSAELRDLNAEILGISGDYVYSHHEWAKHHNLPIRLLSDHTHEVAKLYGSFNETSGYNRRTVFLIGRDGKIAYRDMEYSTRDTVSFSKLRSALSSTSE